MVYLAMDGGQVRCLRKEKGMSQRELAEASGVSKKTLANVEAGKVHTLPSTARKIGAALDVDPRSLARVASRA
jgi:DNA-binding XRE family transcriptional regulator